jgi:endoglucanase
MLTSLVAALSMAPTHPLALGVNLSFWFWLPQNQTDAHFRSFIDVSDARLLKGKGFTHVRLPLEPDVIFDGATLKLKTDRWKQVLDGAKMLQKEGLAVILDVHPAGKPLANLDGTEDRTRQLLALWEQICGNLAGLDRGKLWLEPLNEPHELKPVVWAPIQKRLVAAIRAKQPKLPLVLTGDQWGGIDGLVALPDAPDKNAVYSFHFYDPHTFTHQGASWGARNWPFLKNIPYPGSPERSAAIQGEITDPQAKGEVTSYGNERWNREKIAARMDKAVEWAKKHDVTLYCGEFGVYARFAPKADRLAWYGDVTGELRKRGIGFAFWDYQGDDSFGIASGGPGNRTMVEALMRASLGKG